MGEGGGGLGRGACPLKLKKMGHMHRKRIVACSACAVAQNKRTCANVDCSRLTYCIVYGTRGEKKEKKVDFHYSVNHSEIQVGFSLFGNKANHSEIRILFLIITKTFGRVGSYIRGSAFLALKGSAGNHTGICMGHVKCGVVWSLCF